MEHPSRGTKPPSRPLLASVVIPMYNGGDAIAEQLDALLLQDYEGPFEIVVAENRSTDSSPTIVARYAERDPRVRLVPAHEQQGSSYARNVGSRSSEGEVLLYADADDVATPGWVSAMVSGLADADFVAGAEVDHRRSAADWGAARPTTRLPVSFNFLPWSKGGNIGITRHAFEQSGGWDEQLSHFGEDIDFCWRVQLAGYPLVFVPDAVIRYRSRDDLRDIARQQYRFGLRAPQLLRAYERHGATRPSLMRTVKTVAWLLATLPSLDDEDQRQRWAARAAGLCGRLVGSIRNRTLCP